MRIEIWSDVVCPWCYIGKRRLEEALAGFEHRDEVEIEWRSFQLDPSAPTEPTENVSAMLARKYGGAERVAQMQGQMLQVAAEAGLDFSKHAESLHLNTVDAHRLLHSVGERRAELKEALLHAYFVEARNLADHDVLVDVATSIGLDADEARAVLSSDAHAEAVAADAAQAQAYGATGVPFFVFDAKYGVSGAQPVEAFTQVLERAWADRPVVQLVTAGEAAPGCDGDECAI
ncbi:DsbA family oxidoreductase [Nocardioides plantarum]|uniref:DsbA family oxidoreductase n=1 Tax=Nocardioides plantarum TaxID=29299 RepID=A0ABV5K6J1_9ACTN|nr:DsbA family oxidoreductase [Nocardioides plantarum]